MLKVKLQYFDHLIWRASSLEKTLMLGKIEGRRRKGQQRTRWLDGIIDLMDISLSKFPEMVKDREALHAAIHGISKSRTWLSDWTTMITISLTFSFSSLLTENSIKLWSFGHENIAPLSQCILPLTELKCLSQEHVMMAWNSAFPSWRQFSLRFASLTIITLFLECLETGAGEDSLTSFHVSGGWPRHLFSCQHEVRELFLHVVIFLLSYILIIIHLTATTILSLVWSFLTALCYDVRTLTVTQVYPTTVASSFLRRTLLSSVNKDVKMAKKGNQGLCLIIFPIFKYVASF